MASFEESNKTRLNMAKTSGEPPPTDLEYYAKPENYTGATMSLQQFMLAPRKNLPNSRASSATGQRTNPEPVGTPLVGNYMEDDNDDVTEDTCNQDRDRVRSRRGSVHISSRRGSIQLEFRTVRKISTGDSERPKFERTRKVSTTSRPEVTQPETPIGHEVRWQETADRVRNLSIIAQPIRSSRQRNEEDHTQWARDRFRQAIKTVVILLKWISSLTEKEEENDRKHVGQTFTDIASDAFLSGELKDSGLSFDVSQFKANREINISNEVKSILSIPSHTRTTEQLQTALYGLQHLKSFAEYPLHMQEKLCKVAWFQQIPPRRIIIRQGHYAENFYFILSGQALVRILEKNPKTGEPQLRTAAIMKKGTSFGELALLHHSRRTATVVSQDTIHLLTIGRDDFFDIFMGGNAGEIPEHIRFCSSLDFMKDWPIEKLLENPQYCLFHFFKRGVVIVKDSNQSEWLYIIKSGSCQVIKELKGVVPRVGGSETTRHIKYNGNSLSGLMDNMADPKINTGLQRPHTRARTGRTPTPVLNARTMYHEHHVKKRDLPGLTEKEFTEREDHITSQPGFSKSRYPSIQKAHFKKPKNQKPFLTTQTFDSRNNARMSPIFLDRTREDRQFVNEVALRGPVFVQVEVLKPKDVFGLTTINLDNDVESRRTSVSLVSNGAECIMFSKKFFMQNADELVKKMIRYQVRHYPTEYTLQQNLQTKVDWDLYKRRLVRDTMLTNNYTKHKTTTQIL